MKSEELVVGVAELVSENKTLRNEVERLKAETIKVERFYGATLTTEMVARLHNVSSELVRKYIKEGLIETHPSSTDAKILIRGSVALGLDFKAIKKRVTTR